jgi:hypothetical protein
MCTRDQISTWLLSGTSTALMATTPVLERPAKQHKTIHRASLYVVYSRKHQHAQQFVPKSDTVTMNWQSMQLAAAVCHT